MMAQTSRGTAQDRKRAAGAPNFGVQMLIWDNAQKGLRCDGFKMATVVQSAPLCAMCGEPMKLIRTLPRLGGLPEIQTFLCQRCGQVISFEFDSVGDPLPSTRPS